MKKAWLIATSNSNKYKKDRLIEEAPQLGLELKLVSPFDFILESTTQGNKLLWANTNTYVTEVPDFVLSLCAVESKDAEAFQLLEHIEKMGIYTLNTTASIRHANDKMYSYRIAAQLGMRIPHTVILPNGESDAPHSLNFPFVVKPNTGLKGYGVTLISSETEFKKYRKEYPKEIVAQEAITESAGVDLRLLFIGDQLVGAMKRTSESGFTSNIASGGVASAATVATKNKAEAIKLLKSLQLEFCSVDYLYGTNEMVLCEVNANPGYKMFETVTGVNVATKVLTFCIEQSSRETFTAQSTT